MNPQETRQYLYGKAWLFTLDIQYLACSGTLSTMLGYLDFYSAYCMQNFQSWLGLNLSEGTVQCAKGPVICRSWGCLYMLRAFGERSKLFKG